MRIAHWWYTVPLRLRSIFRRPRVEQELDEELQFHMEHKIEEGIASGLSPREARVAALRAMGGLELHKEEMRDMRRIHWLTDFVDDVQYAIRSLRRTPGLTAFVVITLALGIGMTAGPFSMLDALVFRPYPVPHPGSVVNLMSTSREINYDNFSYREYRDLQDRTKSYDGVVANAITAPVGFSAEPGATPRVKGGMLVSGNYFRVLGVEPHLGRGFRADEDAVPGRNAVTVLAHDFWKHEFGSDPSVVGKTIRLNGTDFTVIGVAPESFTGMQIFSHPDLYMPLAMARVFSTNPQKNFFEDRDDCELSVRARLKPGTSERQAQGELAVLAQDFARENPKLNRNRGAAVLNQFEFRTKAGDTLYWKFGLIFSILAVAVLLVACTNVAGLLLARARTRTREIAVRLALGAGRFRLVRLLLTESLILSSVGGVAGIGVGFGVLRILHMFTIPSELPVTIPFRMDMRIMFLCLVVSVVSAVVCGLAPALQSTRTDVVNSLKAAGLDASGPKRLWGRNMLVVAQVSTSLMLLTASFLMARSFQHGVLAGIGFSKDNLLMARFDPRLVQYDPTRRQQFYKLLAERARVAPGVQFAGLTQNPPLGLDDFDGLAIVPEGFELPRDRESVLSTMDTVDEGFFQTMGIPLVRGRGFQASDDAKAPRVAVVNEQFAKHFWPKSDALGKHFRLENRSGSSVEIVGVAKTVKYRHTTEKPTDFVYLPLAQHPIARMVLLLRSSGDALHEVTPLKNLVRAIDPNMPIVELRTYEDLYRYAAVDGPAVAINLVVTMGVFAFLLAVAGLYGLVAYNVTRRTHEIGIRMALGARASEIARLVIRQAGGIVGVGVVSGLVAAWALGPLVAWALFEVAPHDPVTFTAVPALVVAVALVACLAPALRAARVDPAVTLRE